MRLPFLDQEWTFCLRWLLLEIGMVDVHCRSYVEGGLCASATKLTASRTLGGDPDH